MEAEVSGTVVCDEAAGGSHDDEYQAKLLLLLLVFPFSSVIWLLRQNMSLQISPIVVVGVETDGRKNQKR